MISNPLATVTKFGCCCTSCDCLSSMWRPTSWKERVELLNSWRWIQTGRSQLWLWETVAIWRNPMRFCCISRRGQDFYQAILGNAAKCTSGYSLSNIAMSQTSQPPDSGRIICMRESMMSVSWSGVNRRVEMRSVWWNDNSEKTNFLVGNMELLTLLFMPIPTKHNSS